MTLLFEEKTPNDIKQLTDQQIREELDRITSDMWNEEDELYEALEKERKLRRDLANCRSIWRVYWCPKQMRYISKRTYCKRAECPYCQHRKKQEVKQQKMHNLTGKKCIVVYTDEDEKKAKEDKTKDDYFRFKMTDGRRIIIVDDNSTDFDTEIVTEDLLNEIAEEVADPDNHNRYSGNLGKRPEDVVIIEKKEETPDESDSDEIDYDSMWDDDILDPQREILTRVCKLVFTSNSLIHNPKELEEKVLEAMEVDKELPKTLDTVQYLMWQLDNMTTKVCEECKVEKEFLYIEAILVRESEVDWHLLDKGPPN